MKLIFKKLEIHNFLSFADETIVFDEFKGMTRIKGRNIDLNSLNGAGKTNISNALVYGLYGQLPFKLRNDNVCNRYLPDKNTKVTVYFDSSRRHYKIISGLKGKQSYCNLFEIIKGEEKDITKSTISETRGFVEREILHCDLNLFMRTIYLNSNPNYNFYNLKSADKKEFIDKLFDISIFGDIYNIIHRDILRMDKEIIGHQNKLIVLNNTKEDYENKTMQFELSHKEKIGNFTSQLEKLTMEYEIRKNTVVSRNTELISKCEQGIEKMEKSINVINTELTKTELEIAKTKNMLVQYESSIKDKRKIIDKHSVLKSKLCDDCKSIFSDYYSLTKYEKEIEGLNENVKSDKSKMAALNSKHDELKEKKRTCLIKQEQLSKKLRQLNSDYENEQRELRKFELSINSLTTQLEHEKNATNPYDNLRVENENNISEETKILSEILDKYKYIKFSEGIVNQDNLKKFIIKDLIGLLNNKIKFYLHKLGADYDIVFDEEMNYDFVTEAKSGVEFNNFSLGEQARISIATCFAFRDFLSTRSNLSSNILILDEFFDGNIDPAAIDNIVDILRDFISHNKQKIFIVSHRAEVNDDIFNNIIQVERRNKISSIMHFSV